MELYTDPADECGAEAACNKQGKEIYSASSHMTPDTEGVDFDKRGFTCMPEY
jgi:hypothetical protein